MLQLLLITGIGLAIYFNWQRFKQSAQIRMDRVLMSGRLDADSLRVTGEKWALTMGLIAIVLVLLVLLRMTWGAILIVLFMSVVWVKVRQGQLLGQSVQISPQQFPDLYQLAKQAAQRLDMDMPDIFVVQNPVINAYALGFLGRKSVVLHSATIEAMSNTELLSIIGHEMTHIKCLHTHWLVFTSLNDTLRLPLVSDFVSIVLLNWSRKAEYTCDRGGLLVCRHLPASITALVKVAVGATLFEKMNLQAFFEQTPYIDADHIARLSERLTSHPYILHRIKALSQFADSPLYDDLKI